MGTFGPGSADNEFVLNERVAEERGFVK